MSGDVQPKKRKDKRSKREAEEGISGPSITQSTSPEYINNSMIHIHKETGTGGHWCARVIFFTLLAGLLSIVGLIIIEHRTVDDVDTPVKVLQWATIFDDWADGNLAHVEEKAESKQVVTCQLHENDFEPNSHEVTSQEKSVEKEENMEKEKNMQEEEKDDESRLESLEDDDNNSQFCYFLDKIVQENENALLKDMSIEQESKENQAADEDIEIDDSKYVEEIDIKSDLLVEFTDQQFIYTPNKKGAYTK